MLNAIPQSGYKFDGWNADLSSNENPITIVIKGDKNITANFSEIKHILTIKINGNGSTTPLPGQYSFKDGTPVSLTAVANADYQFDKWQGDLVNPTLNTTELTMDDDKIITADFISIKPRRWMTIAGTILGIFTVGLVGVWILRRLSHKVANR